MNFQGVRERAEQEKADALEEARVEREALKEALEQEQRDTGPPSYYPDGLPYLFADKRSQRRAEQEERFYGPIDDYAAFLDTAPPYEQLIQ